MTARKNPSPGWIYLLWCVGTTRFKIGYSKDVAVRAAAIESQSPYPLRVVAAHPGLVSDEQELHHLFRRFNTHREWFDLPEYAVYELLALFGINRDHVFATAHLVRHGKRV